MPHDNNLHRGCGRTPIPCLSTDWLLEGDSIHLIVDVVAMMDLSAFEADDKLGRGLPKGRRMDRKPGAFWPWLPFTTGARARRLR